ncbi:hypothetical protein FE772_04820 [Lysobacter enzymogenes]|nr:hypothetical protein [Lysobacter enzymogenes]QCW25094.1 hypothetical protein FE772_04820 [Lysobacter enzymogenes]
MSSAPPQAASVHHASDTQPDAAAADDHLAADAAAKAAAYAEATLSPARHAHKFGGSSLADPDRYRVAVGLLDDGARERVAVVSAMQGVTDALLALVAAVRDGQDWAPAWSALRKRHLDTALSLDPHRRHGTIEALEGEFERLRDTLEGLRRDDDETLAAALPGLGEVWSSYLIHAALGGGRLGAAGRARSAGGASGRDGRGGGLGA